MTTLTYHLVWVLLVGGAPRPAAAERPIVISTLPFDNPLEQAAVFGILSQQLGERLGRAVRFEAGKSYDTVIERISKGEVDVGFIGAAAYVEARRSGNVRVILRVVRHRRAEYFGIVVVKRGSAIKRLAQLKGKKVAFVDRISTAGYHYPRALLRKAGVDVADLEAVFAGGHHKVVEMVAKGSADAGACFEGAQDTLVDPELVVPIGRTEPVPGDPVVVRAGIGADTIQELRSALIELSVTPEAKAFFTYAEIDGFVPAVDSDYDEVAELIRLNRGG